MEFSAFKNKKVLVTGHTGFKGAWLSIWLKKLGAEVAGIALDPQHENDVFVLSEIGREMRDYHADIRFPSQVEKIFSIEQPEVVFHLAAQPLVLESYRNPAETFATNIQGTVNVLEAIRKTPSVRAAVMVTTDKCYENREWIHGYRESDSLGGHDPYSASKAAAELVIASYRRSFFTSSNPVAIASARAGNVIGGGDWSHFRLVPDIIRALENEELLEIRNPLSVRPWQHVLEPLGGYLLLAEKLLENPSAYDGAWNFGPLNGNIVPVRDMVNALQAYFGKNGWRDVSNPAQAHEAGLLMLDVSKAMYRLGWKPVLNFKETIKMTAEWYAHYQTDNVMELCLSQIERYLRLWKLRNEPEKNGGKVRKHAAVSTNLELWKLRN